MKKKKISEVTENTDLGNNDKIFGMRGTGLMKAAFSLFSQRISNAFSVSILGLNTSNFHSFFDAGISSAIIADGLNNDFPVNSGTLIHIQRLMKNNTTVSQIICQFALSNSNNIYYRSGIGNGTAINYSAWRYIETKSV